MNKTKRFLERYSFVVIPAVFVVTTILMDITMYLFMGLSFPSRYYFSIAVMFAICGFLFFIRKPSIQYGICIFLLAVHFAVGVANIVLFKQTREIVSVESLTAVRQVTTLTDFIILEFGYMITFALIILAFICAGIWIFSVIGRSNLRHSNYHSNRYRRNVIVAVATLSLTAYMTGFFHITLPKFSLDMSQAYSNYTNDRFVYKTFSNRLRVLQSFGTYSYYSANLAFIMGLKQKVKYKIPNEVTDNFTFEALPNNKQNLIMLQMETIEDSLINPLVMPNLWNFLYNDGEGGRDITNAYVLDQDSGKTTAHNTVKFQGYYAVDRTSITEYGALAGTHLDGVEMNTMPKTISPFALPNVLKNTNRKTSDRSEQYTSIKAFHNFYSHMYNRDHYLTASLGFDKFIPLVTNPPSADDMVNDVDVYGPAPSDPKNETRHDNSFNRNSDYKMFSSQVEKMAPAGEKFFSWILNISSHMPYYDADLFEFYEESGHSLFCDACTADGYSVTCSNKSFNGGHINELRRVYKNLDSSYSQRTQNAVKSYLTGAFEYDRGLGVLFDYLSHPDIDLLDKTTIVFFADHYNNTSPDLIAPTTAEAHEVFNPITGGAQGKMLAFYIYSPVFENESKTEKYVIKDGFGENAEVIREYDNNHFGKGKLGNPNTSNGVITKFITHYDIYSTICDLFHIKTSSRYTLGISAFYPSVNIGFSVKTGLIFNDVWATDSLSNFASGDYTGNKPSKEQIGDAKERLSYTFAVMNNLRPLYKNDGLRGIQDTFYYISS